MTAAYETQKASVGPFELKLKPTFSMHNIVLIMREGQEIITSSQDNGFANTPSQLAANAQNDRTLTSNVPQQTSTLSGRVVDEEGKPVADLPIYVRSINISRNGRANTTFFPHYLFTSQHSRTDNEGIFTIKKIPSRTIHLGLLTDKISKVFPDGLMGKESDDLDKKHKQKLRALGFFEWEKDDFESEYTLSSIRKQGITFYPHRNANPIVFGIKPGTQSKDVVVTVRPRLRIRGQLISEDGGPVANTRFNLRESRYTEDGGGFGSSGGKPKTDADGYFTYYPKEEHDPRHYVFGVRHKGMIAESESILLKPGEKYEELILQLESIP
ncbi:carboxypeptidase regulatory-like domain-containing protein [Candidatus Poribacteria bacterium]|nr:carboxypeptidase regulatory-like domain-containing protein [Candidatus Poribacteria bacterium]